MPQPMLVSIVLDRSGSMESCRDITISAVNEYIAQLKREHPFSETFVTLVLFDMPAKDNYGLLGKLGGNYGFDINQKPSIDYVYTNKPLAEVPLLSRETFVPRGWTPLYDAVGAEITRLQGTVGFQIVKPRVTLVIVTDGAENCSRTWTARELKQHLGDRQERDGWLVIFLGANQDAWIAGQAIGTRYDTTMSYDVAHTGAAMASSARATSLYQGGVAASNISFTADERKKSLGG